MRDSRRLVALFIMLAAALALAAPAGAATTFVVNSTGDQDDPTEDGVCATAGGKCTLRAALNSSDEVTGPVTIKFSPSKFTGSASSKITTSTQLFVPVPVTIKGGNCGTSSAPKPCVWLDAQPGLDHIALRVQANGVSIKGLAITNADVGILNANANALTVRGSWIGIGLDGAVGANDVGIRLGETFASDQNVIGGTKPKHRNVIAGNNLAGLAIAGGSNNTVTGNWFGVDSKGKKVTANETNDQIRIAGDSILGPATNNTIGGIPSPEAAATGACDGVCNVIALGGRGISLNGNAVSGLGNLDPSMTTIAGNFIGVDPTGKKAGFGNSVYGVDVGGADDSTLGGPTSAEGNVISGNALGVLTQNSASNLLIRHNRMGVDSKGNFQIGNDSWAVNITSPVQFLDNQVAAKSSGSFVAVLIEGNGSFVQGNRVGVSTTGASLPFDGVGIELRANNVTVGGTAIGQENVIGSASIAGLRLYGADNATVRGNWIGVDPNTGTPLPNGTGIQVMTLGTPALNNVIGGDPFSVFAVAGHNEISNSIGNAIEVIGDTNDGNAIGINTGGGNGSDFIDLNPNDGPGVLATGPNAGIGAPVITGATTTTASGTAAPNATVIIYRQGANSGELSPYLGVDAADGSGNWSATLLTSQPSGTQLVANQTSVSGNSSELSAAFAVP